MHRLDRAAADEGWKPRYRVDYSLGGLQESQPLRRTFKTKREADIRKQWVAGELAAQRIPDLGVLREPELSPALAEAANGGRTPALMLPRRGARVSAIDHGTPHPKR